MPGGSVIIARQERVSAGATAILREHCAAAPTRVPHFHLHLFGGRDLGPMLRPRNLAFRGKRRLKPTGSGETRPAVA